MPEDVESLLLIWQKKKLICLEVRCKKGYLFDDFVYGYALSIAIFSMKIGDVW